ncbi:MAG: CBS domain-containing protein [Nitrososphaerota archaeon]|nr:CBS domain-containing protein [Candidatus Bathyarchaeota archaeon]MDW8048924.1 CBS domain-containing protein [Nitrososphaerota archaeon]
MTALDVRSKMLVKDVMTSPVITVKEDTPSSEVAKLMKKHDVGCIIVTSAENKPIGIITERDLAERVVANDLKPSKISAKKIMSSPLITIDADQTISEAARRMSLQNIRRLAVMHKGELAGIISSKDILAVTPELIEIIRERARIENQNMEEIEETPSSTGYCDNCGEWSDNLREFEGKFICEECRIELIQSEY